MIPFLSLDECLRLVADNKLTKTNHGRVEAIEFEQSYFRNEASGSIRIARTDKSDFYTKFEQKNYELLCPAVTKDFEIKDRAAFEERKTKITVTNLEPDAALMHKFDIVSTDALLLGAESFKESDFLNHTVSKEMWKMSIKPKCLTGWAWYSKVSIERSSSKKQIIPINIRPLVDEELNKKKTVFNYIFFSEGYLKSDFPELEFLTDFKVKRMTEHKLSSTIMEILEGKSKLGNVIIWKGGASKKKLIIYYEMSDEQRVLDFAKIVENNQPADFNFEQFLIDDGTRLIVNSEKFEQMKGAYINFIKQHRNV